MMKFKTLYLIQTLKNNREEHKDIFLDALEGYKKKAISAFEQKIKEIVRGKKMNLYIDLTQPEDMTKEYDVAIKMFEMTCDEEVELSTSEFRSFVMDDWDWKDSFTTSNSQYTNKLRN